MLYTKYFQTGCTHLVLCAVSLGSLLAQQPAKVQTPEGAAAKITRNSYSEEMLHKYFAQAAHQYKIKTDSGEELKLRDQPMMYSLNPEREGDEVSSVFLWETKDGRPAVIQIIISLWRDQMKWRHEFISLLPEPLKAEFESEIVWQPQGDSIKFTKLADVQAPASNAARRLTQMRQIAKDFEGELGILNQPVAKLTLLPTPLHRYEIPKNDVVDGAIFSLAIATDPEIQLILEARKEADGTMNWYWMAARANFQELNLSYKETKVWSAKREIGLEKGGPGQMPYARQDYFIFSPRHEVPLPDQLK